MCVPEQQRYLASLFAFSAFRILPLCRFVTSLRICGNMRNDSGHVVWRFDQSASFRILDSAFYFPHSAFRNSAFYPQPRRTQTEKLAFRVQLLFTPADCSLYSTTAHIRFLIREGLTENDGHENDGPNLQGIKLLNLTTLNILALIIYAVALK